VSIARPVFATMMIAALIVLGLFSFNKLNVDLMPDVDIPYVTSKLMSQRSSKMP
jgi:HAE1 family hydrophobic/amphiphilic exporter-1